MLQQTQVATVIDYYHRFLDAFPDVQALASADEQDVLALWAGLGYYRRARQMHAAAKVIVEELGGQFPSTLEGVLDLPGVGRYTAGAITSFAYNLPSPILEANTIRLFSRLTKLEEHVTTRESQTKLWEFAVELVDVKKQSPGKLNQAAMELGSQVCVLKSPSCTSCPVSKLCPTFHDGLQDRIPKPKAKKQYIDQSHVLVAVQRKGKLLLRQNQKGEWWEGLWDFPRTALPKFLKNQKQIKSLTPIQEVLEEELRSRFSLSFVCDSWFHSLNHAVTKYKIQLHCYTAELDDKLPSGEDDWKWFKPSEAAELPLTASAKRVLKQWSRQMDAKKSMLF